MKEDQIQAPPKSGVMAPKPGGFKHQRRPSRHERRRSNHSIASFGDIAKMSVSTPGLGGLAEGKVSEENIARSNYQPGKQKVEAGKKHDRQSSNVHLLFDGEEDMQNIVESAGNLDAVDTLMVEESNSDLEGVSESDDLNSRQSHSDHRQSHSDEPDVDGYSPRSIELDDPSPSRSPEPAKQRNTDRNERRSFAGIADLFEDEDDGAAPHSSNKQSQFVKDQLLQLQEENQRLKKDLEKSEDSRRELESEITELRRLHSSSEVQEELRRVKESKINLIVAAGGEIDRLRKLLLQYK